MNSVAAEYHARPWRVFAATSVGVVAVFLGISGLTVALPTVTRELNASAAQSTWILLGYMLITTALILVFGRLADLVGRRPLYLGGLAAFTAATGLCALAPSAGWLIVFRMLQGVGAAAVVTNNTALLTDVFAPHDLGRALGWNATVAAVAQVAGPVVGGAATSVLGWRGLFLVCLPIGLLALVSSVLVIPARHGRRGSETFDLAGSVLSAAVLTAVVLALTPAATRVPGLPWLPWLFVVAAAVSAAAFVAVQARRRHPLVDLRLFRNRGIALVFVAVVINAVATYAVTLLVSLYGQVVSGISAAAAGVLVVPVAVGTVVAAAAAGSLVPRYSPRALTATGMSLCAFGLLGLTVTLSDTGAAPASTAPFLFLLGCGVGLFMTPSTSALMLAAPAARRGIANGLRSALQNVGYLLSTALVLTVVTAGLGDGARRAAYSGTLGALGPAESARFAGNLRVAGLVLTAVVAVGVVVCLAFPRGPAVPDPADRPLETLSS
ncbi:MFS transporter [Nocardia aurantia]|uniref:Riboflavin transporter RibZ n=1 Tax=Nocardia aurantia TaxID=2585199 RepID=A0A7K0E0E1_9NOCA|nr:MFS transporter [Nocardia aurantia]MQY31278.1 Riboflavin transporter RibZ [Nocardia aurantia]